MVLWFTFICLIVSSHLPVYQIQPSVWDCGWSSPYTLLLGDLIRKLSLVKTVQRTLVSIEWSIYPNFPATISWSVNLIFIGLYQAYFQKGFEVILLSVDWQATLKSIISVLLNSRPCKDRDPAPLFTCCIISFEGHSWSLAAVTE